MAEPVTKERIDALVNKVADLKIELAQRKGLDAPEDDSERIAAAEKRIAELEKLLVELLKKAGESSPRETPKKRCAASLPYSHAEMGWRWCILSKGHTEPHMDKSGYPWEDGERVTVLRSDSISAVRDHQHDFVGDKDTCVGLRECQLTWGEFLARERKGKR